MPTTFPVIERLATVAVIALYAVWLGLTAINSTATGYTRLRSLGPLHDLIPRWNFFAPNPGTYDYHLLYRDQFVDGTVGNWQEVPSLSEPRAWHAAIWNPDKFVPKALFDLVQDLVMQSAAVADPDTADDTGSDRELALEDTLGEHSREGILDPDALRSLQITMPYIVLLNYVSSLPRTNLSVATQFVVMQRSTNEDATEPVFLSGFHDLER